MKSTDVAYLAGLVDGEGCLCLSKKKNPRNKTTGFTYNCSLEVTMCDREAPAFCKEVIEVGCLSKPIKRKTTGSKDRTHHRYIHKYVLQNRGLGDFLLEVKQYLKVKHRQADLLIEAQALKDDARRDRSDQFRHHGRLEEIYQEMKLLNKRGV